jgi:hypothetical protein
MAEFVELDTEFMADIESAATKLEEEDGARRRATA